MDRQDSHDISVSISDAITSSRVYRNALGQPRAIEILRRGTGTQWDSDMVEACLEFISDLSSNEEGKGTESRLLIQTRNTLLDAKTKLSRASPEQLSSRRGLSPWLAVLAS